MNELQLRSLDLLSNITPLNIITNQRRSKQLLPSYEESAPYDSFPDRWSNGWFYNAGKQFQNALDCTLTKRSWTEKWPMLNDDGLEIVDENGNTKMERRLRWTLEWTQGSRFNFRDGYTIHSSYLVKTMLAQVQESHTATPAQIITDYKWNIDECPPQEKIEQLMNAIREEGHRPEFRNASKGSGVCKLLRFVPRDPGYVRFEVYIIRDIPGTWKKIDEHVMTQDKFVRYLIVGSV